MHTIYTLTGKQHCLAMRKDFHYQWSNDYCNQMFGYICERRMYYFFYPLISFLKTSSRFIGLNFAIYLKYRWLKNNLKVIKCLSCASWSPVLIVKFIFNIRLVKFLVNYSFTGIKRSICL